MKPDRRFTGWGYPGDKAPRDITHLEWCESEVRRCATNGGRRRAEIITEVGGRLDNGVARIAVAWVER
jgi:hypothetical protein